MNEFNNNILNINANKNYDNNILINLTLDKNNLSQSIKIFHHKPNSIIGLKYNFSSHNSDKNLLKKNDNLKYKNNIEKKNNLLLNSIENKKKENKINLIRLKEEKKELKLFKYNINNIDDSNFLQNKNKYKKHNSYTNIFYNNSFLYDNINKINKKENKSKFIKDIEEANFKISLLNNMFSNINIKYLYTKIRDNKKKYKENILLLKNKFKKESKTYEKQIYLKKLRLFKIQDNFIHTNKLKENIQKEELLFKKQKCLLIEKIMELSITIQNQNKNFYLNIGSLILENNIDDISTDEMLITKNKNVSKINKFYPSNFK